MSHLFRVDRATIRFVRELGCWALRLSPSETPPAAGARVCVNGTGVRVLSLEFHADGSTTVYAQYTGAEVKIWRIVARGMARESARSVSGERARLAAAHAANKELVARVDDLEQVVAATCGGLDVRNAGYVASAFTRLADHITGRCDVCGRAGLSVDAEGRRERHSPDLRHGETRWRRPKRPGGLFVVDSDRRWCVSNEAPMVGIIALAGVSLPADARPISIRMKELDLSTPAARAASADLLRADAAVLHRYSACYGSAVAELKRVRRARAMVRQRLKRATLLEARAAARVRS